MTTTKEHRPGPFAPVAGPVESGERDARFDNQPPLGERIAMEFEEELRREGLLERAATLAEAAERAPQCDSSENCGKIGDFVKQCRAFEQSLEAVREKHNRPLIDARTQLKARTDAIFFPIGDAVTRLRASLDEYVREEEKRVERERREAEEAAAKARADALAEAKATGFTADTIIPDIQARKVEAPVARGDYGARIGTQSIWSHEIESVRQLPNRILTHPRVIEALDKVIAAEIRGGCRELKGARIWEEKKAVVR